MLVLVVNLGKRTLVSMGVQARQAERAHSQSISSPVPLASEKVVTMPAPATDLILAVTLP